MAKSGNSLTIKGSRNLAHQIGQNHESTTEGNGNWTLQDGQWHYCTTIKDRNFTGQQGTRNDSVTWGDDNYVIQSGDGNKHQALGISKSRAHVGGNHISTAVSEPKKCVEQIRSYSAKALGEFKRRADKFRAEDGKL
ncbi:hypothetical protein F4777DRAFT_185423 [Nemania sp. FL0916]|nr:hypothetical protein F4777DRAFT_185423 [Nemania sp. FL0916]